MTIGWSAAVASRLDFDAERFALLLGHLGDGRPAGGKRFESGVVNTGVIEGRQRVRVLLKADQARDGLARSQLGERVDFFRSSAESGALEQMRGEIVVPVGRTDRGQIVLPAGRPG